MSLNNRNIEKIKVGEIIWDERVSGFGARKQTLNGSISLFVKTRIKGRQKLITIGKYGIWTINNARNEAKRLLGLVSIGNDPTEDNKNKEIRLKELADIWIETYVLKSLKKSSAKRYFGLVRDYIKPSLGNKNINSITIQNIVRFHDSLRKTPRNANYCLATISSMWSWGESRGLILSPNPCKEIKRYKEVKRKRYLSIDEAKRLGISLVTEEKNNPYAVAAIRLLILTGARLSEILTAKWEWIDGDILNLPVSKSGPKEVNLPSPVLEILKKLPKIEGNPFIIVGKNNRSHLVNLRKPWMRIIKKANLLNIRIHDLRHIFASFAVGEGASLTIIGGQLGHKSNATTKRYAHLSRDPIRQVTETTAIAIQKAMQGHGK